MILSVHQSLLYETQKVIELFLPNETFEHSESITVDDNYVKVLIEINELNNEYEVVVEYSRNGLNFKDTKSFGNINDVKKSEIALAQILFENLSNYYNFSPPWGILTGVRPEKLFVMRNKSLGGLTEAEKYFKNTLMVSDNKIKLLKSAFNYDALARNISDVKSFSLYVSVPFCPSRCHYCSFVSHSIEKTDFLVQPYCEKLCEELIYTSKIVKKHNLELKTIYFGGGTPTQLSAQQLNSIITCIENNYDLSNLCEFTVECGRPDTISYDKLCVLKNHNVTRISINPQTMNDDVLVNIGRKHTVAEFIDSFKLARSLGFENINTDLIAGLPSDTLESFNNSIDKILELNPENITIHTLAFKRSSNLVSSYHQTSTPYNFNVNSMLKYAYEKLCENYQVYYLYRQSKILSDCENTGWTKPEKQCFYNIYMMNEIHSVISVGAGAVTRLNSIDGTDVIRINNHKYPYEYINRFDELLLRKEEISKYYEDIRNK